MSLKLFYKAQITTPKSKIMVSITEVSDFIYTTGLLEHLQNTSIELHRKSACYHAKSSPEWQGWG